MPTTTTTRDHVVALPCSDCPAGYYVPMGESVGRLDGDGYPPYVCTDCEHVVVPADFALEPHERLGLTTHDVTGRTVLAVIATVQDVGCEDCGAPSSSLVAKHAYDGDDVVTYHTCRNCGWDNL